MNVIRAVLRAIIFLLTIISYILLTLPFFPFLSIFPNPARKIVIRILQAHCKWTLFFMGITVSSDKEISQEGNYLIVSNHLSYLDVLVITSQMPTSFVTSIEIKKTPFLGQLCLLAGCLFVERRSRENLGFEIREITKFLQCGGNVTIFPEGTSTNGSEVIRFRRPLFQAALDAGRDILPLAINYREIDGELVSSTNSDLLFWYGKMTFIDHLWGVFLIKKTKVELSICQTIPYSKKKERDSVCLQAYEKVARSYRPVI